MVAATDRYINEGHSDALLKQMLQEQQKGNKIHGLGAGGVQSLAPGEFKDRILDGQLQKAFETLKNRSYGLNVNKFGRGVSGGRGAGWLKEPRTTLLHASTLFNNFKTVGDVGGGIAMFLTGVNDKGEPISNWEALSKIEADLKTWITAIFELENIKKRNEDRGKETSEVKNESDWFIDVEHDINKRMSDTIKYLLNPFNEEDQQIFWEKMAERDDLTSEEKQDLFDDIRANAAVLQEHMESVAPQLRRMQARLETIKEAIPPKLNPKNRVDPDKLAGIAEKYFNQLQAIAGDRHAVQYDLNQIMERPIEDNTNVRQKFAKLRAVRDRN